MSVNGPFSSISFAFGALMTVALFWGGAQPGAVNLVAPPFDLLVHALCFGVMSILYLFGLPRFKPILVVLFVCGIGAMDELRQMILPGRHGSWLDFAMDVAGASCGFLMYVSLARLCGERLKPVRDGTRRAF
jgi:hypothetical protein